MKINFKTKKYTLLMIIFLVLSSFLIGSFTNAGLKDAVSGIVGHVIQFLVWILGGILFVLIYILIWVAQYNDFINAEAVKNGWVIVRDLCNMFFILILLVIAFAAILRIESYNLKKTLPKLLIMAVLINFSKTICGLFIDFAQVIMLTFVNGFKDMGSANLTSMLGIKNILAIDASSKAIEVSLLSIVGSYLLALLYAIVSVIVVLVLVAVLVIRMVMLWIYIVLSPLAYLLSAFPAGQKYAQQWWQEFSKQVIVGPVLAFFIWLSFVSLGGSGLKGQDILNVDPKGIDNSGTERIYQGEKKELAPIAGSAEAGTPDNMIKFIISIGMLMGGLMITQQIGGMAGSAAGKGIASVQGKYGPTPMRWGRERLTAFQGKRELERKRKAAATGERMFGLYKGGVKAPGAAATGLRAAMGVPRAGEAAGKIPGIKQIGSLITKRRERKDKYRENIYKAFEEGSFIKEGVEYTRSAKGDKVTVKDRATGEEFSMGKHNADFRAAFGRAYSPARQVMDEVTKTRIDKKKGEFAGFSAAELRKVLTDTSASRDDKMTARLILATKGAFKDEKQMRDSRQKLMNRPSMLKEFDEASDKRFGVWNNTREGFKDKVKSGVIKIEDLDSRQITAEVLDLIRETVGNIKYADTMKKISKTQIDHNNITKASKEKIRRLDKDNDFSENALVQRRFHAGHTGDMIGAMGRLRSDEAMNAAGKIISGAKGIHLAKLKEENFDINKAVEKQREAIDKKEVTEGDIRNSVSAFVKQFQDNINVAQLDAAYRSGEASNDQMKNMVRAAFDSGRKELQDGIKKNNNLKSFLRPDQESKKVEEKYEPGTKPGSRAGFV